MASLEEALKKAGLSMISGEEGLILTDGNLSLSADLRSMLPRLKQSNLEREILIKAAKIKNAAMPLTIVDATAGLGADSLILAAAGYNVILFEYDPVIAALLRSELESAKFDPELGPIVNRMKLIEGDSISALNSGQYKPDIILLDPMFPKREKSALVKKKFQLLSHLEAPCSNEEELFAAAENARPRKIIVKRPAKGPFLAGRKPSGSISGKAVRIDSYYFNRE